ncbi:hypothetical protein WICPIJ_009983 [Wickerhamomyces pijperi]|uniref:Transmembrane protein n=1 Tax=Wickerhamomyces pijperi TaxID=599730 RepID=A0A9P8TB06_WICPI|nr:hypothetical protein WICPIJ_009983 [Wickerhamomyces pijperi]
MEQDMEQNIEEIKHLMESRRQMKKQTTSTETSATSTSSRFFCLHIPHSNFDISKFKDENLLMRLLRRIAYSIETSPLSNYTFATIYIVQTPTLWSFAVAIWGAEVLLFLFLNAIFLTISLIFVIVPALGTGPLAVVPLLLVLLGFTAFLPFSSLISAKVTERFVLRYITPIMVEHTMIGKGHGDFVVSANNAKHRFKLARKQRHKEYSKLYRIIRKCIKGLLIPYKISKAVASILLEFSLLSTFVPPLGFFVVSGVFARSRGKKHSKVYIEKKVILKQKKDIKNDFTWFKVARFGFWGKLFTMIPGFRPFAHVLNATATGIWASKSEKRILAKARRTERINSRKLAKALKKKLEKLQEQKALN